MPFDKRSAKAAKRQAVNNKQTQHRWRSQAGQKGASNRLTTLAHRHTINNDVISSINTRNINRSDANESPKLLMSNDDMNLLLEGVREIEQRIKKCLRSPCTSTRFKIGDLSISHDGRIAHEVCCQQCNTNVAIIILFERDLAIQDKHFLSYWIRWIDFADSMGSSYVFFEKLAMFMGALIPGKTS